LVVCLGLSIWLFTLKKFNLQQIEVTGNSVIRDEEILAVINKDISGKYFWLFPKSHFLILPKTKIKNDLLASFAQILELKIERNGFQSLIIELAERQPYALWCDSFTEDHCYFMDNLAYLYDRAPNFSNNVYFKYLGGISGVATSTDLSRILRRTYLEGVDQGGFEKINLFIRLLEDININGYKLGVEDNNDCHLFFNNGSRLIFDSHQNLDEVFKDLQALLIDLGDLKDQEFDYLDLRFDNKIVYKFKEE